MSVNSKFRISNLIQEISIGNRVLIKGKKAIVYIYQVQVVSKYLARALKDGPEQMINWVCE